MEIGAKELKTEKIKSIIYQYAGTHYIKTALKQLQIYNYYKVQKGLKVIYIVKCTEVGKVEVVL